jgi:hypothetical protein
VKNIHPVVLDFINHNRNHLEHADEFEPNKKYPSRRSWKRVSDVLSGTEYLDGKYHEDLLPLSAGFIGMEAGISFNDFVKNHKKLLTPEDIVKKGRWKDAAEFTTNDHAALIDKLEQSGILKEKFTPKQAENFANYFMKLPSECAAKLFKILGKTGNTENTKLFYGMTIDGVRVQQFMVTMLSPQAAQVQK